MNLTPEEFRAKPDCEDAGANFPRRYVHSPYCLVNGIFVLSSQLARALA
jgi:hypothetical protein